LISTYLIVVTTSYVIGSIPFGYILVKVFRKQDIRESGSGNIGATNVARSGAKGLALATLFLDVAKGWVPVIATKAYLSVRLPEELARANGGTWLIHAGFRGPYGELILIAALAAVVGHCFSVWLRFRGGKGVATGLGAFLALAPQVVLLSVGIFVLAFAVSRYVSLSSIIAAASFPIGLLVLKRGVEFSASNWILLLLPPLIIIGKHHENIRRLFNGTEHRVGSTKVPADPVRVEKNT
jgi:acyl phosphate:glycerol-3-phosphate acyltransferase